jgi:hypothetical protein
MYPAVRNKSNPKQKRRQQFSRDMAELLAASVGNCALATLRAAPAGNHALIRDYSNALGMRWAL